jgi:protein-S-isoprenylcysteine O-methyltransferase Ste14
LKGTAYLIQATLILLWWIGLSMSQSFFSAFQFPKISSLAFNSFFAPDIIIITLFSLIRAYKPIRDLELIILGGFAYGSFYCMNASILTNGGYLATTLMALGLFYNIFLVYQSHVFKESRSSNKLINALKTLIQIICVWIITLILFPWLIIQAFEIDGTSNSVILIVCITLFILFSILGLSSAFMIVQKGEGTPLPADQTRKLVVSGPYRYVRNPMAIAGLGQGLAICLFFNSIHLLTYTIVGGLIWQLVVRPIEEKNMALRFGEEYEEYRRKIRCWIPRIEGNAT